MTTPASNATYQGSVLSGATTSSNSSSMANPNAAPSHGSANSANASCDFVSSFLSSDVKDSKTAQKPVVRTISNFTGREQEAPGFENTSETNMKALASTRLRVQLPSLSLGRPTVRGGRFVVGTDSPEAKENFFFCMDPQKLKLGTDPVLSCIRLSEYVSYSHWLTTDTVVCACGENGKLQLYSVRPQDGDLKLKGEYTDIHSHTVREIAGNDSQLGKFASAGFDKTLCIVDALHTPRAVRSCTFDGVIGSVKWPTLNQGVCVSCTMDSGVFTLFDTRVKLEKPAFAAKLGKDELFTHERYTDFHVMFGFGDGEIQEIDMREGNKILRKFNDPYVEGIGGIDYNPRSNSFLVTGFSDFTVWRVDPGTGEARVWGHSFGTASQKLINDGAFCTSGSFVEDNTVLTCTSAGTATLYAVDFTLHPPRS